VASYGAKCDTSGRLKSFIIIEIDPIILCATIGNIMTLTLICIAQKRSFQSAKLHVLVFYNLSIAQIAQAFFLELYTH
jgi:hypothetical protein